ncbi:MAG: hypothetical protein R3F33_06390 [Planctomycetota bacterium]
MKGMGPGWVEVDDGKGVGTGPLQGGVRHGVWSILYATGKRAEGPYVLGARHGQWSVYAADGTLLQVFPYVAGKRHGQSRSSIGYDGPWMSCDYVNGGVGFGFGEVSGASASWELCYVRKRV